MSEWTYEMLRYAFSWNEDSADKAMKYVVTARNDYEKLTEFHLLDILLLSILTEKDEIERTSALIFLEEHGTSLVFDYTRLHKVYFVLDNILVSPVDGQSMTYALKSQVLVTYTALLIQFDCFETEVARFEGFVDLLYSTIKHTNKSADRMLRACACECLHELETWYPGLLFPLLGEDWSVSPLLPPLNTTTPQQAMTTGSNTLGKFVNDELLHIHESYSRLFFTTFMHFTEQVVQEALKHPPVDDADADTLSLASSIAGTPCGSRQNTPPDTPRRSNGVGTPGLAGGPSAPAAGGVAQAVAGNAATPAGQEALRFRVPASCHPGPEVAFELLPGQTPPRLPRKLVRTMTRSVSLVLENMKSSSSWTKMFLAERLSLFIRVLALPCRVIFHHFSPMLHSSRPMLLHTFLVVTTSFSREIDPSVSETVVTRLFALTQDTAIEPCFRLLAINWLIALSAREPSGEVFELLWAGVQGMCPKWHDPLELKEMKLQALLYCCRVSGRLPKNLLSVLESMSEFMYCCRPAGAHSVVFRFLLRIVINFAEDMDRLEVPQCFCDFLRSRPKLLPSVLAVAARSNSEAVQYQILRSLGDFVARLEPPSRIQCYFGLLETLSGTAWLDPGFVLCALRRLVFCPSSTLTWQVGMKVLITCRRIILTHPQAIIYEPMQRLLHHLATYQDCVDLRDRALLYLRLLTHAGSEALGILFHSSPGDVEEMTRKLTPVLPKTFRLMNGPVPFLRFFKSFDERRKLGILDRQCAVFVLPPGRKPVEPELKTACTDMDAGQESSALVATGFGSAEWEVRWGDSGDDHQFPREWLACSPKRQEVVSILDSYRAQTQARPPSIRLPFVLEYFTDSSWEPGSTFVVPQQLFSLELTFSSSEHFVPIAPIRIPYIAATGEGENLPSEASPYTACADMLPDEGGNGFLSSNKLLLNLEPISPVPTSFGVRVAFNDCRGHMYFGQLETFTVAFQDLFLPVRLPLELWSDLFKCLWQGGMDESCWSVKVLDMERESVRKLISTQLDPFLVPGEVMLAEKEDFDFEQEEHFARFNAHMDAAEGGVAAACESDSDAHFNADIVLNVDAEFVIIFIPPCHHLLMRFSISDHSTIVRVLTDRFQLLSYMDSFFLSWSRPQQEVRTLQEQPQRD